MSRIITSLGAVVSWLWEETQVPKVVRANPDTVYWMDIFSNLFVVKIVICIWKDENKWKRGRDRPIFLKKTWAIVNLSLICGRRPKTPLFAWVVVVLINLNVRKAAASKPVKQEVSHSVTLYLLNYSLAPCIRHPNLKEIESFGCREFFWKFSLERFHVSRIGHAASDKKIVGHENLKMENFPAKFYVHRYQCDQWSIL